jgi:proteasome lid subunit RPN8/RPN11
MSNNPNNIYHSDKKYKLIITDSLESKIRFMCSLSPNNEWSGVLFYSVEGDISSPNNDFKIIAEDFCLCDIGSATYTEFETRPEVVNYMCVNDLIGRYIGLIHSHDTMSTFFSGTDLSTLSSEGSSMLHFLSLIVNNAGQYTAAITKKVKKTFTGTSSERFQTYQGKVITSAPVEATFETSYIEYYDLDIEFSNSSMYDYLRNRYNEICATKSKISSVEPLSSILNRNKDTKKANSKSTKNEENTKVYTPSLFPSYDLDLADDDYNYGYAYDGVVGSLARTADDILKRIFNWGKPTYTKTVLETIKECEKKKKKYKNNFKFYNSLSEKVMLSLVEASKEDGILNGDRKEYLSYLAGECMDALESLNYKEYSVVNDVMDLLNEY